ELKQQLAPDGVLIIPVGDVEQALIKVVRIGASDNFEETNIEPVKFVPLLSGVVR
ncbi:MAG: protein-L-isoaspartate(D-aspartate) O-methyltransferase, partial [Cellvibrionaceae bacterium]